MHRGTQVLFLLLCCFELSTSQYQQSAFGLDPQPYGQQHYDLYPSPYAGYESGFFSPSGYTGYGTYSPVQMRSVADDPAAESAIKSAMAPLNNIVSSVPAQPVPVSPIIAILESDQRSATNEGNAQQKKSNCTTGCSAAKSAVAELRPGQQTQQSLSQSSQQFSQQSSQQSGGQMCQCPCTQGWAYPHLYYPQGYPSPYSKSGTYYTAAHRTRQPSRAQYRPYTYYSRPSNYYDPNYHRGYYSYIRN